ncbi:MAG TPA: hypothetical protein PKA33_02590 [Amaricoccus sp.]|uniref:hypothetical protein n=1 Tax=Amaricoccus sp. TaxID=1872485 RepID=UPI002CCFD661|nr:hypothetical protein [Amaricoccus sp.]HMQ94545.1 hypothetical protein [Amaricoccus sp.]HMR51319.1 hypothetical protein [Amaricoccus sp.]HMR61342.1 hypothetical protein [Amaricoccus sp.]HMT98237.1 hypothetical protein [Amaricoccus sp.]
MRRRVPLPILLLAAPLAACAGAGEGQRNVPAASAAAQERACAEAVAAHVGKDPAEVTAVLAETGADGLALVRVTDGGRLHTCTVDANLSVHEIRHPRA